MAFNYSLFNGEPINRYLSVFGVWLSSRQGPLQVICRESTVGVLIIGLLVGQIAKFSIPAVLKNIFFDLFIFTIGYEVGPILVRSFKNNGVRLVIDGCFFAVIASLFALITFKVFHVGQVASSPVL